MSAYSKGKAGFAAQGGGSDFEDDGKDQGALGGVFVDVALEVDADFFFDYGPVGFFFGVGLLDGFEDDFAGSGDEFGAVIALHAAGDDFGRRFEAAGLFVDGDDGADEAVFGKMAAIADDDFFDFLEGAGIDENASGGDGIAGESAVFVEFEEVTVFEEQDFAGDAAELVSERGVAEEMAIFAVDGNEIARLDELQDEFLFFLARGAGNVNGAAGIVVIDESAAAEHVVEHAEDGFFVAGDDAGGEDDAVVFVDGNEAVIVYGDAGERGHGLGLRAAGHDDDALGVVAANVLGANDHAVRNAQVLEGMRDFDVVDHAAADESDFAADTAGDIDNLLDAMNGRSKARKDDAAGGAAAEIFDAGNDGAFRGSEAGALDVGRIAEKGEDAFVTVAGEGVEIERGAVDGSLVDFEIAGVNDDAERRANG